MINVRLLIEYDGTEFRGWQRQAEDTTIQATLEDIISQIAGKKTTLYGAGRTDSGVHAMGQVAHFYTEYPAPGDKWRAILNGHLPATIRILEASEVPMTYHSQKDVTSKIYEYRILNRSCASALDRRVYFYPGALDWERARMCLPYFIGEHDFRSFQGAKAEVLTTVRRILRFDLIERGSGLYALQVEGTGFLKHMVRTIAGTVIEVAEGRREPDSIPEIISAQDRRAAGRTLPPYGLFLVKIFYRSGESYVGH